VPAGVVGRDRVVQCFSNWVSRNLGVLQNIVWGSEGNSGINKRKVKFTLEQVMKAQTGSKGIVLLFL
jgi:hypothetical protein